MIRNRTLIGLNVDTANNIVISHLYSTKPKAKFRPRLPRAASDNESKKDLEINNVRYLKQNTKLHQSSEELKGEILYGIYPVLMALKAKQRSIFQIYYNKNSTRTKQVIDLAIEHDIKTKMVDPKELHALSKNSTKELNAHQGICADVEKLSTKEASPEEDNDVNSNCLSLLLCAVGDPHNLGAILRSAYYLGVDKVFTTNCSYSDLNDNLFSKSTAPLSPVVSKSSSGVLEIFQPIHVHDPKYFVELKKSKGWTILGSCMENPKNMLGTANDKSHDFACDKSSKSNLNSQMLIIGNEGFGIPNTLSDLCDNWIYLKPGRNIDPDVDSLNVSVATALLINSIKMSMAS